MLNLINTLYPSHTFNTAELNEIAESLSKPAVKKYLVKLSVDSLQAIAQGMPKEADSGVQAESAESYLRRQAVVQGQLIILETLLTIEAPAKQA